MSGRQTRGRQRIPIRLIENQDDLYATFSKRRHGVYKKASELSTLCGADVGVIIFSPSNHPFSFFSPTMQSVVNRYMNPNQEPSAFERVVEDHTRIRIQDFNRRLDELQEKKEELKQRESYLDEIDRTRPKGWWEQVPVESLNKEQLQEWKAWFQNLRSRVTTRIEELKNGGSSSSAFQQQIAPNYPYATFVDPSAGPSISSQSYGPHGAAYAPISETMMAGQFPSQYYVPPEAQYPSIGGGTSHIPPQYHHVPPQAQNPFVFDSSTEPFPSQYTYFPPQGQDLSTGGGTSHIPPQYHHHVPPQARNPFVVGPSTEPFPAQYTYFPPQDQDLSIGGGTSHIPPQYHHHVPPQARNPFVVGPSTEPFPTQYTYFPSPAQDPSTGGGTTQGGPSNINP